VTMYNGTLRQREMLWKTSAILDMKGDGVGKRERVGTLEGKGRY
jgi:hypothetical protein